MTSLSVRLKCWFGFHNRVPDRAEDKEPGGYQRVYPNEHRESEPIDACYVVEKCVHCGQERRIYGSVDIADRMGIPFEWERPVEMEGGRDE